MMRVYLDDRLLEDAGLTLGSALATARAGSRGRLIVDVLADGRPVPQEHLQTPPPTSPYAGELRMATADPRGLASRALRDAGNELRRSSPLFAEAGELLQAGKLQQALETLKDSLPAWEIVQQTSAACLSIDGMLDDSARGTIESALEALAGHLRQIKQSLNAGDWSTVADALLYDSGELIGRWTSLLDTVASDLERA